MTDDLSDYVDEDETRARQSSPQAIRDNYDKMVRLGAYNLLKVMARPVEREEVIGYVTLLTELAGKTPREMELLLGLKDRSLALGAVIYRLLSVPAIGEFLPRGYTGLVGGLKLRADLQQSKEGYRRGQGAWQITLTAPVPATLIATLEPNQPFEPGIHPDIVARYGPNWKPRSGAR